MGRKATKHPGRERLAQLIRKYNGHLSSIAEHLLEEEGIEVSESAISRWIKRDTELKQLARKIRETRERLPTTAPTAVLKPIRERILEVLQGAQEAGTPSLAVGEIAKKIGNPLGSVYSVVMSTLVSWGLVITQKEGCKRMVRLSTENEATEVKAKTKPILPLDEIDELILEAQGETPEEKAKELGMLLNPVENRMTNSIPKKFGVDTFEEAKEIYQKSEGELIED